MIFLVFLYLLLLFHFFYHLRFLPFQQPAWVHVPITETYFTLHPEQRKFRTMMEAKEKEEALLRALAGES